MTRLSHPPTVPYVADEREMLTRFLDAMRLVVRRKLDGVSHDHARAKPIASSLSLLGIVQHLAWTECRWFRESFADEDVDDPLFRGDSEAEFTSAESDTIESVLAFYDEQCAISRAITARALSLDDLAVNRRFPNIVSLRWIVVHMIEETARHAGHADVIREALDGSTGD
jgi:hypothetical protein